MCLNEQIQQKLTDLHNIFNSHPSIYTQIIIPDILISSKTNYLMSGKTLDVQKYDKLIVIKEAIDDLFPIVQVYI